MYVLALIASTFAADKATDAEKIAQHEEALVAQAALIYRLDSEVEVQARKIAELEARLSQVEQGKPFSPETAPQPMSFKTVLIDPPFKGSEKVIGILSAQVPLLQKCYADGMEGTKGSFTVTLVDGVWLMRQLKIYAVSGHFDGHETCWDNIFSAVQFPKPKGADWYKVKFIFE